MGKMNPMGLPEHWCRVKFGDVVTFTKKPKDLRYSEYNEVPFVPMNLIPIATLFSKEFILKPSDTLSSGTYLNQGIFFSLKLHRLLKMVNRVSLRICRCHLVLQQLR